MDVRDAVEADAGRMAELTGAPTDVMTNIVHDRTVRVAEPEDASEQGEEDEGSDPDGGDDPGGEIVGFVSYDVQRQTVHVTQLEGTPGACERLLAEPALFAREEGMSVEFLVGEGDETLRAAAESAGFVDHGAGPRFGGTPTVRYRLDPG
jgi:hypothetical protein